MVNASEYYGLGRRFHPDPRDYNHLMTARLGLPGPNDPALPPRPLPWRVQSSLNQASTSTCVGHGWKAKLNNEPIMVPNLAGPSPEKIYKGALPLDPWPDNDGEVDLPFDQLKSGTSVRAAAQYLQSEGHIGEYTWAFDVATVQQVVLTLTPVVLGTPWGEQMFSPSPEGIITYTGNSVGGHCYLCIWADVPRGLFLIQNSWGDWGIVNPYQPEVGGGFAWIPGESLDRLIHEDGEACTATELSIAVDFPTANPSANATVIQPPISQTIVSPLAG